MRQLSDFERTLSGEVNLSELLSASVSANAISQSLMEAQLIPATHFLSFKIMMLSCHAQIDVCTVLHGAAVNNSQVCVPGDLGN